MADTSHVLIIGAGAIGSFYGAILKRAGCRVDVVLRSDVDHVRAEGFAIDSPLGDLSWRPDRVYGDGEKADADPDYVICCVKVLPDVDRAALIRPWLGAHTRIVLIENGIHIEAAIAEAFPDNALVSCIAFIAVSCVSPGVIDHKAYGNLIIGAWPNGISEDCRALEALLVAGGIEVELAEEVVLERWRKSVWNAPFNPLSVLVGGADTVTMLDTPGGEDLVRALMAEVMAVAAADGHTLTENTIDDYIAGTRRMPAYRNSMALDYLAGRPLEIDAILGNVVAIAQRLDVSVPRLETMQVSLRMAATLAAGDD